MRLHMIQQTIDDKVIKDLFGMSGQELQEIRTAIAGLQRYLSFAWKISIRIFMSRICYKQFNLRI